jgi:hypothetical protein
MHAGKFNIIQSYFSSVSGTLTIIIVLLTSACNEGVIIQYGEVKA